MQPKMCVKCKKNVAVVFITKIENGVTMNEGYCLKCARSLGVPQDSSVLQKPFDNAPVPPAMHDGNAEGQKSGKTSGNGGSEIDNVKPASP